MSNKVYPEQKIMNVNDQITINKCENIKEWLIIQTLGPVSCLSCCCICCGCCGKITAPNMILKNETISTKEDEKYQIEILKWYLFSLYGCITPIMCCGYCCGCCGYITIKESMSKA